MRLPLKISVVVGSACTLLLCEALSWSGPKSAIGAMRDLTMLVTIGLACLLAVAILSKEKQFQSSLQQEEVVHAELLQSEERMRMAMEAAGIGVWDSDLLQGKDVWSPKAKALLELEANTRESLEVFIKAIHPDDREMVTRAVDSAILQKTDYTIEFRTLWPDGTVHWQSARGRVLYDGAGSAVRMIGTAIDIDKHKQAEERVRLQAAALEAAANAIVITDPAGTIVRTNRAFSILTGYTQDEVLGKNPRLLSSGQHDSAFYSALWKTISSGKTWQGEMVNRRKDGSLYTEEMTITPVLSLAGQITHFVAIKQDVSLRKRAEEALRAAEEKYRTIFQDAAVGIFQSTPEGRFLSVNPALAKICGYDTPEQVAEITDLARDWYVDPERREEFKRLIAVDGIVRNFEYQARRKDGAKIWLLENARAVRDARGEIRFYEGSVHDVTDRKLLEDQLRQAQKMEAIGRLAGGVAHDFNNALAVISGHSELLQIELPTSDPRREHAIEILKAGRRAASLTRQLLAFSRKQTIQPVVLDLNSVVADVDKMLRRLIGEDIDLTVVRDSKLDGVKADRGQIEQVLMNLAVNARDAMPGGGRLLIETANTELDEAYVRQHPYAKAGRFVMLKVSDTGCGMDKNTQAHIFEPFFTTKEIGKGTGLGLSMVYGIVKQSEGYISVYSEVDRGTTFRIYLPKAEGASKLPDDIEPPKTLPRGTEAILLVEDEDSLRGLARGCLQSSGYHVLEAHDGKEAMDLAAQYRNPIQLLLTDMIMPGMNGAELAERLQPLRPEMKVVFMSGYTHDLASRQGVLKPGTVLLEKPFSIEGLLNRVRQVLDGKLAHAADAV
jgi:two-component system cell cycle sensor histidine kinase/response regulator CckA